MREYVISGSDLVGRNEIKMLPGEIKGVDVVYHSMENRDEKVFEPSVTQLRIFFLCSGDAEFTADDRAFIYDKKAIFATDPEKKVLVYARTECSFVEIQFHLTWDDKRYLWGKKDVFPITGAYEDAVQYRDPFKSEKTISRMIIPHRTLPRFSMGSVETYGDDLIGQHEHPLLDQFFFTFPENDMILLIDDDRFPVKGNTLLHIPLGSNHGVKVEDNGAAHYLWIDVVLSPEGEDYLDDVHRKTGTRRSFEGKD